ncbi:MAG: hypothetical protein ACKOAC_05065 [Fluviibacter sp.]
MHLRRWLFLVMGLASSLAYAESYVVVCYNWGCLKQVSVVYPDAWLKKTLAPLRQTKTPAEERAAAAEVVRKLYVKAAEQTPIGADEAGNEEDEMVNGRMDCIDHSTTTANMLSLLQKKRVLRWHEVGPYAHRTLLVASHYSATLVETGDATDDDSHVYTIDPWDVEHGSLPPVAPVREWAAYRFYSLETQHHMTAARPLAGRVDR